MGTHRSHVQPDRRRARSPVVEKGHRPRLWIGAILRVGHIEDAAVRLILLVADQQVPGRSGVMDRSAVCGPVVLRNRARLRRNRNALLGCARGRRGLTLRATPRRRILRRNYCSNPKNKRQNHRSACMKTNHKSLPGSGRRGAQVTCMKYWLGDRDTGGDRKKTPQCDSWRELRGNDALRQNRTRQLAAQMTSLRSGETRTQSAFPAIRWCCWESNAPTRSPLRSRQKSGSAR